MKKLCRISGKAKLDSHERALERGGEILHRNSCIKSLSAYRCKFCGKYHLTSEPVKLPDLSARTLNWKQASLTERAGKLSLPVNQSVKGKAGLSAVSERGIALLGSKGHGVETLPATKFRKTP